MEHQPTLEEVTRDLFRLLRDVAPERAEELARELKRVRPTVVIDEHDTRCSFTANSEERTIRVGMPSLKRQLAMAFAYVIVYRAMVAHAERTGARRFPLDASPRVDEATSLLAWAMRERLLIDGLKPHQPGPNEDWPERLPFPHPETQDDSDERIALELYYMALGVDLHHEFTHLRRGHSAPTRPTIEQEIETNIEATEGAADIEREVEADTKASEEATAIEQEIEADVEAAEWLLSEIPCGDPRFDKRLLGVALSHMYEVFLKLEGSDSDRLHPPLVSRLWNRVEQHAPDADHVVWAFVAAALMLHLEMSGRREYDREASFRTFRDLADYLLNIYAPPGS